MRNLTVRVLSALVALVILVLAWYFLNNLGLLIICLLVAFLGQIEFTNFLGNISLLSKFLFVICSFLITVCIVLAPDRLVFIASLSFTLLMSTNIVLNGHKVNKDILNLCFVSGLGLLYTGLLSGMIVAPLKWENGLSWFLLLLAGVFANDTLAYFFGRAFGKRPLAPRISPNKTQAGAAGGILGSILGTFLVTHFLIGDVTWWLSLAIGISIGVFSPIGDLFESLIKRVYSVKDSGKIMPGHGGVLDRIDGLLFAAPIVYIFHYLI